MTAPARPVPALPAPTSVAAVIDRLLIAAGSQEGYREGRDSSGWNNDNAFGVWFPMNRQPWCAMFVSWAANKAAIPTSVILKHSYTPTGYSWFKGKGQAVNSPRRGDIFYVYSPSQGKVHHVGIVESVGSGYVRTIEGNTNTNGSAQGDGVYRLRRTITSNLRFCRPNYAACVKAPPGVTPKPPAKPGITFDLSNLNYAAKGGFFRAGQATALSDARLFVAWLGRLGVASAHDMRVWEQFLRASDWRSAGLQYSGMVRKLQLRHKLTPDGVVGPKTAALLTHDGYGVKP